MTTELDNNRRVAKNTLLLYFRMLLLLVIGLYTSRVCLRVLGVEDYGINNVIAGVLSFLGIITGAMSTAISRYITVELGKGCGDNLKTVFNTSIAVQFMMGLIVVVIIGTIGLWFVKSILNIPEGREDAAIWCLLCATITTFISLLNVPFNAEIVAHEDMSIFALVSIYDAVMKLLICYAISISPFDKLISYSSLLVIASITTMFIYWIYCYRKYEECRFRLSINKKLLKEIWGFSGWTFLGNSTFILNTQGVNFLINVFFGVVVNAARGIANQINGVVQQFVSNFMIALNPQITKSFSSGDKNYAYNLACRGARFSFFIMLYLAIPIILESKQVLKLWLGNPPEYSDVFLIWTLFSTLILMLGNTMTTLILAQGDIKEYQLKITLLGILPFPLSWLAYAMGAPVVYSYYIYAIVYWIMIFVRFELVKKKTGVSRKLYYCDVVLKCHSVGVLSFIPPLIVKLSMNSGITRLIVVFFISIIGTTLFVLLFGLEKNERTWIISKVKNYTNSFISTNHDV